jgi:hypothetical protein
MNINEYPNSDECHDRLILRFTTKFRYVVCNFICEITRQLVLRDNQHRVIMDRLNHFILFVSKVQEARLSGLFINFCGYCLEEAKQLCHRVVTQGARLSFTAFNIL